MLQNLVYQFVPNLAEKEEAMRREFKELFGKDPLETTRATPHSLFQKKKPTNLPPMPTSRHPSTSNLTPEVTSTQHTPTPDDPPALERRISRHSVMSPPDDQILFKLQMDDK